jgi:hypothetical protein
MGCLWRAFLLFSFASSAVGSLLGFLVFFFIGRNADAMNTTILGTEIKPLKAALVQDGPAWVKVTIRVASGAESLNCAGQKAVWMKRKGERKVTEDIRRGGKWETREIWKFLSADPQTVPVKLAADQAEVEIRDWKGIHVSEDLLQVRRDEHGMLEASLSPGATETVRCYEEAYLPEGAELWAFGAFIKGRPQVLVRDKFFLTSLGRENFAKQHQFGVEFFLHKWGLFVSFLVFAFLFLRTLLKSFS